MNDKIKLYPLLLNLPRIRSVVMEWCKGEGRVVSNRGGWQSDLFYHIPVELKELFDIVDHNVDVIHSSSVLKLEEFWINVNKPNDSNSPHTHHDITPPLTDPGISGVFYINIPEGDAGDILLGHERVQPYENLLILFPSDMIHMVYPNRTEKNRISLSFNYV
jgi:hypothetical protein|tara:strand:+ start:406 stop:891 length:486 start_codon:yes stop_codon:yes gene_type:complete